jgi:hypothetical protein
MVGMTGANKNFQSVPSRAARLDRFAMRWFTVGLSERWSWTTDEPVVQATGRFAEPAFRFARRTRIGCKTEYLRLSGEEALVIRRREESWELQRGPPSASIYAHRARK